MEIERLRIDAFGRLGGFDTGPDALGSLVVVLGPNEAGKSTLFTFLTTALYGFQPASRERNPHVPWNADEAGGEIWVRLSDERCARIARKLRSSPAARLTLGDSTREIRNQPVPWVEHVPRTVFRQVFAVTLAELAGLDEETWARIQDRVLGAMGTTDLRSAREVADALESEASAIWRPNRRGNQRLRDLQEEVRSLRGRRKEALERDRSIRQRVEDLENARHELREMREERERDAIVLERVQELLPVKRQLDRISTLRAEGGPKDRLALLPSDPAAVLERMATSRRRSDQELAELDAARAEPDGALRRFDDAARVIQDRRAAIVELAGRAASIVQEQAAATEIEAELRELAVQERTAAAQLFRPDAATPESAIRTVSLDLLRDRVERLAAERRAGQAGTDQTSAARPGARDGLPGVLVGGLVAVGIAAVAWGSLGGPEVATTVGVAALAVGLTLAALRTRVSGPEAGPSDDPERRIEALRREIAGLLDGLPVRSEFLETPGVPLVSALDRLQTLVRQREERTGRLEAIRARRVAFDRDAAAAALDLGLADAQDGTAIAAVLQERLAAADRAEEAARGARGELERLDRASERARRELEELSVEEGALRSALREAAGHDAPDPLAETRKALDAHARADRLLEELERAHPNLADLRSRIAEAEASGASWASNDDDLARRRARVAEVQERIESLVGRTEALETEIQHLRERETVDAIDGEIQSLQEEERRLIVERDRKWLVAQLVREADRRFRHEHQPDLLRRASKYLCRLTAGRYERILVDELGDGELFELVGPGLPRPVPLAPPISTGTLEQAYLSLRLAIVDHLDQGAERLPIFVDETLVNWDAERRERGLSVLAELSASRQVFAFTCHPGVARRLEEHGARVVELER